MTARDVVARPAAHAALPEQIRWVPGISGDGYFYEGQAKAMEHALPHVRKAYEGFCNSGGYPRTLVSWANPKLLKEEGPASVLIRLKSQRGLLLVNGQIALDFPVCTGKAGKATPARDYKVLEKDEHHYSYKYDSPMECFMRLTPEGIGMHIGDIEDSPASHGCIRLPIEACKLLYKRLPVGAPVRIIR